MNNFLERHPDLNLLDKSTLEQMQVYRSYNRAHKIIECWEKQNGEWVDVTEREKLKEAIAEEQEAIEHFAKLEAKRKEKEHAKSISEGQS